ncbi:MAG TPA: carbohydrate kinase family protein, partial [Vicinamibacterales bacterium]|nr:carbohydrate kinase family protein [Vicinamibacterales bacterium]
GRGLYWRHITLRLDLLTVGDAFHDLIFLTLPRLPRLGEELRTAQFVATFGGGAVITATAAARLGARARIVSALSADAVRALRRARVSVVNVRRPSEPHAVTAALSTRRDRSFVTFTGVNDRLQPRLPAAVSRQRARHVHFAFAPERCARWAGISARLRAAGTTTSWDFGWEPALRARPGFARLLRNADFVFVNEIEAAMYAGASRRAAADDFWRRTSPNTVIKLGRRGSRWIATGIDERAPAPRVRSIDTTGAGDAFDGGFLFAFLRGAAPRDCLRAGNFVGAQSTRAAGGIGSLPDRLPNGLVRQVGRVGQVGRTTPSRTGVTTGIIRPTRPTRPTRSTRLTRP